MHVVELKELEPDQELHCGVAIVGGGPAGLTVARGLENTNADVLVLESGGLAQTESANALNSVEVGPDLWTEDQAAARTRQHSQQAAFWRHDQQGFGVRCRGLGGSTHAWAGKSATFDGIDYERRDWVDNSGWPIDACHLSPFIDRAADDLNLNINCYDDRLWETIGRRPPQPLPDVEKLRSFFWQFAQSRIRSMDILRAGDEFLNDPPQNCRILTGATVLEIKTNQQATSVEGIIVTDESGCRRTVRADKVVLAASAIENARLLLNSSQVHPTGVGNAYDLVGRYLMDHPSTIIGRYVGPDATKMAELFGFYCVRTNSRSSMYMRGLAPTETLQRTERLLNCAVFMLGERALDDPWDAAKRLLRVRSAEPFQDVWAILKSPGLLATGTGRRMLQSNRFPESVARFIVAQMIRLNPNFVAEEFQTGGLPHKLTGVTVQAISEQVPDPENRILLGTMRDRFGALLPEARWKIGDAERRTFMRLAELVHDEFNAVGLKAPEMENWVTRSQPEEAVLVDMAHTAGTTRMSDNPKCGVVDTNCQVHGVNGLFVAGSSVFPTSGHANPTLMIVALAHRLAAHIGRFF